MNVSRLALLFALVGAVSMAAGCDRFRGARGADVAPPDGMLRPMPRPSGAMVPAAGAATVDEFDTTTAAQRAAAVAAPAAASAKLGRSVATLGDPADPGFWLETPLVTTIRPGRVVAVANGKSVQLELRPTGGAAGSGSRISLPALRLLEVGLTGLHEVEVFAE